MKTSIDTLKLRITDYTINKGAPLTVQPAAYDLATGETNESTLYQDGDYKIQGTKAYINRGAFKLTINDYGAFLHTSVPKQYHGSNDIPVNGKQTKDVLIGIQKELKENGIHTDIFNADLSRIDISKQAEMNNLTSDYNPAFYMLQGKRMNKRDYGSTILFHNTQRQLCFYDKVVETQIRTKVKQTGPSHTLRNEVRLLSKRAIIGATDLKTVRELISEYGILDQVYIDQVRNVLKYDIEGITDEQLRFVSSDVEKDILRLKGQGIVNMGAFRKLIIMQGIQGILKQIDQDTLISLFERHTTFENKRMIKSRINKFIQENMFNIKAIETPVKVLYQELYKKFAV
jgi:hypothetical protein